ncbi:hypothetical protein M422DRAFT_258404 [Sphaerobolus stellatus SS14]|uniref:Uncharacterized protein n=1 Tax=Sphaerobolus stellatus (strain SS14) TaxID=990650 RepID=A0A0C9UVT7_SPHS4|nr:hypothetical protein M422DRAFT_258404 [Sphaerobolus stellatus SS14]
MRLKEYLNFGVACARWCLLADDLFRLNANDTPHIIQKQSSTLPLNLKCMYNVAQEAGILLAGAAQLKGANTGVLT